MTRRDEYLSNNEVYDQNKRICFYYYLFLFSYWVSATWHIYHTCMHGILHTRKIYTGYTWAQGTI